MYNVKKWMTSLINDWKIFNFFCNLFTMQQSKIRLSQCYFEGTLWSPTTSHRRVHHSTRRKEFYKIPLLLEYDFKIKFCGFKIRLKGIIIIKLYDNKIIKLYDGMMINNNS
jgi:hypothetical protein